MHLAADGAAGSQAEVSAAPAPEDAPIWLTDPLEPAAGGHGAHGRGQLGAAAAVFAAPAVFERNRGFSSEESESLGAEAREARLRDREAPAGGDEEGVGSFGECFATRWRRTSTSAWSHRSPFLSGFRPEGAC